MDLTVAKYTFNSWLRKGIGASINEMDNLGTGPSGVKERASIPIDVAVNGQNTHKDFSLLGPGDVIGINPQMIVRTEPLNWITNFEPNYLPFIEFYDEDFLWRYTPAKPNGDSLRPWVMLLILKDAIKDADREFSTNDQGVPLATVTVKNAAALPVPGQNWAWSHVHTNDGFTAQSDFEKFLQTLTTINNPAADKIICRLLSARKLDANSAYRAFVVPAFETGRLAGLGLDTAATDAQQPSWTAGATGLIFPIYYQWYFRTGDDEDFESLVKALVPRVMDPSIGIRDMDGSKPGFGLLEQTDLGAILPADGPQDIIGLEGALLAPTTEAKPVNLDLTKPFFPALQNILNFPADIQAASNTSTDPVVSPPLYGEHHALLNRLDITKGSWFHELNKDPRDRVPAGFGTSVIQKGQEDYVARAWAQVQKILQANKRILFSSFSMAFATTIKNNFTATLSPLKTLVFFSPLLKKIKGSPTTLGYQLQQSTLPSATVSTSFRRILRPRGAYFQKLARADANFSHEQLLSRTNAGTISAAPPKKIPSGINTVDKLASAAGLTSLPAWLLWIIRFKIWLLIALLAIILLIGLFTGLWAICFAGLAAVLAGYAFVNKEKQQETADDELSNPVALVTDIKQAPAQADFVFVEMNPVTIPTTTAGTTIGTTTETTSSGTNAIRYQEFSYFTATTAGADSLEAAHFRQAAIGLNQRMTVLAPATTRATFDIANAQVKLLAATDPRTAYPKQLASLVYFSFNPAWLLQADHLVPAMAYPDFEDPMYEKLRDISSELLIPNLNLIPPDTISLLVTNPEFIESYMVGLNHEFGKELLWREYPTDERGSYFRQFWDVKGIINNDAGLSPQLITEKYKDITPIDTWSPESILGVHNNRGDGNQKNVVLVVRGELLKKYPNTIIYAQKAHMARSKQNVPEPNADPVILEVMTAADMATEIKFPMFKAEVLPDIKFFGFELTIEAAKGDDHPQSDADDWGWYFVIQQIPGEPRFGMDISFEPDDPLHITWDDLSWANYDPTKIFIDVSVKPLPGFNPTGTDSIGEWGTSAANMAYILFQKPVMIAVHAKEMLQNLS